ncbi:MAG: glycosyl hydrolase family 18 protein [Chloroflexota bacterium]
MRRPASLLAILLLALGSLPPAQVLAADPIPNGAVRSASGRVLPPMPNELRRSSVHAEMLSNQGAAPIHFEPGGAPSILLNATGEPEIDGAPVVRSMDALAEPLAVSGLPNGLRKEVFGFLPYWMLTDSALGSMNYHLVSTIAYFSVNANKDGYLVKGTSTNPSTGWAGWTSSRMTQVTNSAHAQGVKVVLTVSMMAWDGASAGRQAQLLGSATARSRLVRQIVSAIRTRGADGVNLDFEPLATSLRDEYVSFVHQLKRGLLNAGVGNNLTVCVMAGAATWATGYDVAGLTASGAANALFVMGYDFHWSGSSRAGGVAPIQSPYTLDVAGTMADFLSETSGSKLIWGVPYYGRTWPTNSGKLNATTLGGGSKSYVYTGHLSQAAQYGRRWDDVGKVPWYRHWDGAAGHWVQGYYDDVQSLGAKYDLINARGLAGTGMWTLLMDQGRDELWRLLANKFVNDTMPPQGGITLLPRRTDAEALVVRWHAQDYGSGISHFNLQYRRNSGAWKSWLSGTKKTTAWFAGSAGSRYEFRVRAFDLKGNSQRWVSVAAKPASVHAGAFARVTAAMLNVRSGPGTGYGLVATAAEGDVMYVVDGPISSGGYSWFRVQYGFGEWPSAEYPLIAWVAGSYSDNAYLAPSVAPSVTMLSPFVAQRSRTSIFSPNGDGVQDTAATTYRLKGDASSVQLDVISAAGSVVRSIGLGAQATGTNTAAWNGRITGGAWAPAGRYLLRITAKDDAGVPHSGPAAGFNASLIQRWGITADRTAPTASSSPRPGAEMVPAKQAVVVRFSEPVTDLSASTIQLRVDGVTVPSGLVAVVDQSQATLTPSSPLPVNTHVRVLLSNQLRDAAGNQVSSAGWGFTTAPGRVYSPSRRGIMAPGSHLGYRIAQDGDLLSAAAATLAHARRVTVAQRATLPNLPGRWLLVDSGPLAGRWLREAGTRYLRGLAERLVFSPAATIRLAAATHIAHRFDSTGQVTASRTLRLSRHSMAHASARAIINGRAYWRVIDGPLAGYWLAESSVAFRRGALERLDFVATPRIDVAAGKRTGYRFDSRGLITSSITATVSGSTGMRVSAWAVINGRAHFLVSSGTWAGTWLPESQSTRLHI